MIGFHWRLSSGKNVRHNEWHWAKTLGAASPIDRCRLRPSCISRQHGNAIYKPGQEPCLTGSLNPAESAQNSGCRKLPEKHQHHHHRSSYYTWKNNDLQYFFKQSLGYSSSILQIEIFIKVKGKDIQYKLLIEVFEIMLIKTVKKRI